MADWAPVLTATAAIITALGGLILAVKRAVREVHVIVNQQRTDMMARIDALSAALRAAGIAIPKDPSRE